jgi:hypothetical protein
MPSKKSDNKQSNACCLHLLVSCLAHWSPCSPDFNPCNYFLRRCLKNSSRVVDKTRYNSKENIMEPGSTIQENLCYRAVTHLVCRLQAVEELNVWHLNTVLMTEFFL